MTAMYATSVYCIDDAIAKITAWGARRWWQTVYQLFQTGSDDFTDAGRRIGRMSSRRDVHGKAGLYGSRPVDHMVNCEVLRRVSDQSSALKKMPLPALGDVAIVIRKSELFPRTEDLAYDYDVSTSYFYARFAYSPNADRVTSSASKEADGQAPRGWVLKP